MAIDPRELLNELPDLVCYFAPDGTLLFVNQAYADYYETTPDEMIGRSFLDLVPPEHRAGVEANLAGLRRLRRDDNTFVDEHYGGDASGDARWMRWTNKARFDPEGAEPIGFIGIGRDITNQKLTQDKVRFLATHDSLTGVLNRHTLRQHLMEAIGEGNAGDRRFGLLYLDLDGLKAVNDNCGHSMGDTLLKLAAGALTSAFRADDIVARMGGDEFVILCPGVSDAEVLAAMLERARDELQVQWQRIGSPEHVGVSAGYTLYDGQSSVDELLQMADEAMYKDKRKRKVKSYRPDDVLPF